MLITIEQFAEALDMHKNTVLVYINKGVIDKPTVKSENSEILLWDEAEVVEGKNRLEDYKSKMKLKHAAQASNAKCDERQNNRGIKSCAYASAMILFGTKNERFPTNET